jgi:hypothetical protein
MFFFPPSPPYRGFTPLSLYNLPTFWESLIGKASEGGRVGKKTPSKILFHSPLKGVDRGITSIGWWVGKDTP